MDHNHCVLFFASKSSIPNSLGYRMAPSSFLASLIPGDKCSPRESAASRGEKKASQADDETRLTIWAVLIARCPLRKVLYHSKLHTRQIKNNDYDATSSSSRTPARRSQWLAVECLSSELSSAGTSYIYHRWSSASITQACSLLTPRGTVMR